MRRRTKTSSASNEEEEGAEDNEDQPGGAAAAASLVASLLLPAPAPLLPLPRSSPRKKARTSFSVAEYGRPLLCLCLWGVFLGGGRGRARDGVSHVGARPRGDAAVRRRGSHDALPHFLTSQP